MGRLFGQAGTTIKELTSKHYVRVYGLPGRKHPAQDRYVGSLFAQREGMWSVKRWPRGRVTGGTIKTFQSTHPSPPLTFRTFSYIVTVKGLDMDSIAAFMSDTLLLLQTRPAEADHLSPAANDKRTTSVTDAASLNVAHDVSQAAFESCAATDLLQAVKGGATRVSHT